MKEKTKKSKGGKTPEGKARSLQNLKPPFSKENQPEKRGRPKGVQNRRTVARNLLDALLKQKGKLVENPITGDKGMTILEAIIAKQVVKALAGDRKSAELVLDSAFGKIFFEDNGGGGEGADKDAATAMREMMERLPS